MNPQLLQQILPYLQSLAGIGAGGSTAPAMSQLTPPPQQYPSVPNQGGRLPMMGMPGPNAGAPANTPPASGGAPNLTNNLNSYNAVMRALKNINPASDGNSQKWAPGFQFRSQAPAQSTVTPNPSVNAIGGLFTSPAGQQLLSNLRQYLQQGPQTPDIYGNA